MAAAAPRSITTEATAQGVTSCIATAQAIVKRYGVVGLPIIQNVSTLLPVSELTVYAAKVALENNVKCALAVQHSKKRSANGNEQVRVGWVVLP